MVRQFRLTNTLNEEYNLMSEDSFGHSPQGLGVAFANSFYGVNANFINDSIGVEQNSFEIQIAFGTLNQKPYQEFNNFVNFLNHQPITIEYSMNGIGTRKRDAIVSQVTKTEINEQNMLNETFEFNCITPFYEWVEFERKKREGTQGGKRYNARYNYRYGEANSIFNTIELDNDSAYFGVSDSSPLEIEITATEPVSNPEWEIVQNGVVVQNDRFFIDLEVGQKLIVSSEPQNQRAILVDTNGFKTNVYMKQDFTKSNFVVAPLGKSTLEVLGSGFDVYVRIRKEWLVV